MLGVLLLGQGLCEGLDINLHEVIVWEQDSSVDPISLLAENTVLLRILKEVEKQQELREIESE